MTFDNTERKHTVSTDLPGCYPITSARGHKYIFLMVGYDSNYIHAVPIKSRKAEALMEGFNECYNVLRDNRFEANLVRLDYEVSKLLIDSITTNKLTYQLASLGDHRMNYAERAIQTYKNHFISAFQDTNPTFPRDCWDLIMPQIKITLNLLRTSRINPKLSAYSQIHCPFNFNKTPVAPLGYKIIIHDQADEHRTWAPHGTPGFYAGPVLQHYRNYKCYIPNHKAH